jgi:multidrug efflux pump subunit AcrA (membrane-fusion protein)
LNGIVKSVANIGEQNPKNDSKVFEVIIQVNEKDSVLLPAMTSGNNIIVDIIKNVLSIPLECVYTNEKGISFVYVKSGFSITKKEIKTGKSNENFIIIEKGLTEGEQLLLSPPENGNDLTLTTLQK